MRTVDVKVLKQRLEEFLDLVQSGDIVVTVAGEPRAVLQGVADEEFAKDPAFWQMIQGRRQSNNTITWEEAERRLAQSRDSEDD